jgi:two-component sensor histidine kinase
MAPHEIVPLLHVAGFVTGIALYAMLAAMTLRQGPRSMIAEGDQAIRVPLAAAALGLLWNSGALVIYGLRDFGIGRPSPIIVAISFAALGFLPAVVVQSAVTPRGLAGIGRLITTAAYAISAAASALQVTAALQSGAPSRIGFLILTVGYGAILLVLVALTARQVRDWRRSLFVVALAAFAVSSFHLSSDLGRPDFTSADSWMGALLGHHASLALVLVILYQDYRFAFADLFLRRALLLLALVAFAVTLHVFLAVPLLGPIDGGGRAGLLATSAHIALWVGTALSYPLWWRAVSYLVDRVVLERADYRQLRGDIASEIEHALTHEDVLERACTALAKALSARHVSSSMSDASAARVSPVVLSAPSGATLRIPTTDAPRPSITVADLQGGRRLFSDDLAFLESVAIAVARRLDVLRVMDERRARDLRESEILQLATEAELRALRAQLNPHFLFNALTTIGYLVQAAPQRAVSTIYRLTELLRAVLRRTTADSVTLQEELDIVEAYLAIESARFESRLDVTIDVPDALRSLRVPPLLLQPLVENAIKHGVSPLKRGGSVSIVARALPPAGGADGQRLLITVSDTGVGMDIDHEAWRRNGGVGLVNIERRLARHFGDAAALRIQGSPGRGTTIELTLPAVA